MELLQLFCRILRIVFMSKMTCYFSGGMLYRTYSLLVDICETQKQIHQKWNVSFLYYRIESNIFSGYWKLETVAF